MEGVFERHDSAFLRTKMIVGVFTCQLECRFVGLCAGVTEKDFFGKGRVDQFFSQAQRRLVGIAVSGVPELRCLVVQRLPQRRMRVAQGIYRNPARKVDVLFSLLVPQT
ncbi:hypothetical protein D3C80_1783290 [compost metagenome]